MIASLLKYPKTLITQVVFNSTVVCVVQSLSLILSFSGIFRIVSRPLMPTSTTINFIFYNFFSSPTNIYPFYFPFCLYRLMERRILLSGHCLLVSDCLLLSNPVVWPELGDPLESRNLLLPLLIIILLFLMCSLCVQVWR